MANVDFHKKGKLITCILPTGKSADLVKALSEKGITRFNFANARGSDIADQSQNKRRFAIEEEKEILTLVVSDKNEADDLFWYIFESVDMNRPGGGFMYMTNLSGAVAYLLPEIASQDNATI